MVPCHTPAGDKSLAACIVPTSGVCALTESGKDSLIVQCRRYLRERLPQYMVPARWSRYDGLPKNQNGKTDRANLKQAFETLERAHGSAPARTNGAGHAPERPRSRRTRVATHAGEIN